MIELSIPQPGEESKQAKDLVFSILSKEHPLSMIEIVNKIHKHYNISITYQAIRKAIDKLVEQNVLKKDGKKYYINKEWILKLRTFFDDLLKDYETGKRITSFSDEYAKENYAVYTLHSLYELDKFWSDILVHLADNLEKGELRVSFNYGHYTWWMLINLASETNYLKHYRKKKIDTYYLWLRNLPLNRWAASIYNDAGHKAIVKEIPGIDELVAVNIVGNTVIQVKYPKEILKKVKKFYETYKSVQEMSMKEITELAHSQCEIKFILFKNPTIAKNINDTYLKLFRHPKVK